MITTICKYGYHGMCGNIFCACRCHQKTETETMGTTQHVVENYFYVHDDRDAFPDDQRAVDDFHGAVAALLADPRYEDLAVPAEDPTAAVAALDWEARVRIIQLLTGALARVRLVTPEQAKSIPDDRLRRL